MNRDGSPAATPIKIPGPDHPITIEPNPHRIVVSVAGRIIANTHAGLTLREAGYPPVHYIPRHDVDMTLLAPSARLSYCPYKGDCSYFSVPFGGQRSVDAAWSYENPHSAVASIKQHIAFYPDRVDTLEERGDR